MNTHSLNKRNKKKKKKSRKQHGGKGKGKIITKLCDLPDDILQKILSRLPTKEAARTSVLSKRWKNQWMGINVVDLELIECDPEKRQKFIDFAEKLFVVCNNSSLKKFSLLFDVGKEFSRVKKWLSIFVNPTIEELNLELYRIQKPLVLPNQFFSSEKLTKFQLSMRQFIKLPSTINFQNLVTLTLKDVIFPNLHHTSQFFFGLPSLKEMSLIDCNWKKVGTIIINCPLLQNLFIREWKDESDEDDNQEDDEEEEEQDIVELNDDIYDLDVALQDINYHNSKIGIIANRLVTFSYDGDLINGYQLFFTILVSNATIDIHEQHNNMLNNAGHFVFNLFKALYTVEKLSISEFAIEALCQSPDLEANLPTFYYLDELRVISLSATNLSCQGLLNILRKLPFLKEIEFQGITLPNNGTINPLPTCFWIQLKVIKIYNFCGNEGEMNAIKFLLQTTLVLDTLYIKFNEYHFDSPKGSEMLDMLMQQIFEFPRASMDCDILIE